MTKIRKADIAKVLADTMNSDALAAQRPGFWFDHYMGMTLADLKSEIVRKADRVTRAGGGRDLTDAQVETIVDLALAI